VLARLGDSEWGVIRQLAASLGALPPEARPAAVTALLIRHGDDTVTLDAALSGLRGCEPAVLAQLLGTRELDQARCEPALVMLAATIVRSAQDAAIQNLLQSIADAGLADWRRSALLRGAEVALLRAKMPGPPTDRGQLKIDKLAPGGSYFFSHQPDVVTAAARPKNRSVLRLSREPEALVAVADSGGGWGPRVQAVLARIDWPGKPGALAPLKPLSRDEQARYEAGSEIYKNICQACHQPDGHGRERMAADLIGSELALAPAEVTARILLNGKEGTIGLMPPFGAGMTDEQVASVLTYIRREWGQPGTAVDPATIKAVRALTAGRPRPWNNAELLALPAMKQ